MRVKELVAFIKAREQVRLNKEAGKPRPWTKDPILDKYRFCNVRREDDRVTRELKAIVHGTDLRTSEHLWFWWVMARLFNKQRTMACIERVGVVDFHPERIRRQLKNLREEGPIFNGAYIVSTNGKTMDKVDYLIDFVLKPLWGARKDLRPQPGWSLEGFHSELMRFDGMGSFMAAQVVADMKYVEPLNKAEDWWTFAASGPGSRRGLNRVVEEDVNSPWKEAEWRSVLGMLLAKVNERLENTPIGKLHAQDLQNCLCEWDKYQRALLGEGTPKQLYKEEKK